MIPIYGILSQDEIKNIHQATVQVLSGVGVKVYHAGVLERLADAGASVDRESQIVKMGETVLMDSLEKAGRSYVLYGRDGSQSARFGYGDMVTISSPEQYSWVDPIEKVRRPPTSADTHNFDRASWDSWMDQGSKSMAERAAQKVQEILDTHEPEPLDEALAREIDGIVESARKHLL